MHVHAAPSATASVVFQVGRAIFQPVVAGRVHVLRPAGTTLLILILAANTSFQGFPRLAALLAHDRFFARQFTNLGDRLVLSNGMLVLAALAAGLLWIYERQHEQPDPPLRRRRLHRVHALAGRDGAATGGGERVPRLEAPRPSSTRSAAPRPGIVTTIVLWTKFAEGAWLVIVAGAGAGARDARRAPPLRARHPPAARRGGRRRGRARPPATRTLLLVESLDEASGRGALVRARRVAARPCVRSTRRAAASNPGDPAALVPGSRAAGRRSPRVLDTAGRGGRRPCSRRVWRLPRGESEFVHGR